MSFSFRPAKREDVPLLIGLAGGTGSGKTMSALELARGLAGTEPFCVIDTESGRAKLYADFCQPWHHGDMKPPFSPQHYGEAIKAADVAGFPVIVVDSFSHEHAGDGGLLDMHDAELERMAGDDWQKRERVKMAAWIAPKTAHKKLVSQLLQMRAHLIVCLRAEEKIEIVKNAQGKTEIVPKRSLAGLDGWVPISEKSLPFEMTASFLLTAGAPGIPKPIKLPEQFKPFVPLNRPISEETGRRIAEWARGTQAEPARPALRAGSGEGLETSPALSPESVAEGSGSGTPRPESSAAFNAPSTASDDPIVQAANEAAEVEIPSGTNQGKKLRELLESGENGTRWLRYALRNWNNDDFAKACWAFARVYQPDLYGQVLSEKEGAVA